MHWILSRSHWRGAITSTVSFGRAREPEVITCMRLSMRNPLPFLLPPTYVYLNLIWNCYPAGLWFSKKKNGCLFLLHCNFHLSVGFSGFSQRSQTLSLVEIWIGTQGRRKNCKKELLLSQRVAKIGQGKPDSTLKKELCCISRGKLILVGFPSSCSWEKSWYGGKLVRDREQAWDEEVEQKQQSRDSISEN